MVGDDYILTKSDTCKVCPHQCAKAEGFCTSPLSIKELLLLMGHLAMFRDNVFLAPLRRCY